MYVIALAATPFGFLTIVILTSACSLYASSAPFLNNVEWRERRTRRERDRLCDKETVEKEDSRNVRVKEIENMFEFK